MGCTHTRKGADEVTAFEDSQSSDKRAWSGNHLKSDDDVSTAPLEHFKPKLNKCMTRSTFQSGHLEIDYEETARRQVSPSGNDVGDLMGSFNRRSRSPVSPVSAGMETGTSNGAYRPDRIIFIRHGESEANVDRKITARVPDNAVHLTANGREQASKCGEMLAEVIGDNSVSFIVSPYVRTRETFHGIARSFGPVEELSVRLDAQVREQDHGNFDRPEIRELHKEKGEFGAFYYRFPEGESMADVYDRASIFLESLYRRWEFSRERNLVIISHGLYILVFLMRLFRYSLDELYSLEKLRNCEMVVLERPDNGSFYDIAYTWCPGSQKDFGGLRKRPAELNQQPQEIWDGDPEADLLVSQPAKRATRVPAAKFLGRAWASSTRSQEAFAPSPSGPSSPGKKLACESGSKGVGSMRVSLSMPVDNVTRCPSRS